MTVPLRAALYLRVSTVDHVPRCGVGAGLRVRVVLHNPALPKIPPDGGQSTYRRPTLDRHAGKLVGKLLGDSARHYRHVRLR